MDSLEIINRIAKSGGILGACAKSYLHDKARAAAFIVEVSAYCGDKMIGERWGRELTNDIEKFAGKRKVRN